MNEVMNARRAVVVSDDVGCGPDLIEDGVNGWANERVGNAAATETNLINEILTVYFQQVKILYNAGGRNFAVLTVPRRFPFLHSFS